MQTEDEAGVRAELTDAHRERAEEGLRDLRCAFLEGTREKEDRIYTAEFAVEGDRIWAGRSGIKQSTTTAQRSCKGGGLGEGMLHKREADFVALAVNDGEHAFRHAGVCCGFDDCGCDHLTRARMAWMGFHHDRATDAERADGVRSGDGDGEREIAGTKDDHWPQRHHHAAHIRLWKRLTVGNRAVNACLDPRAFADDFGKQPGLTCGSATLGGHTGHGQAGLGMSPLEEGITKSLDVVGDGLKKESPLLRRLRAKLVKGRIRSSQGSICVRGWGLIECNRQLLARGGITGVERSAVRRSDFACDDGLAVELHEVKKVS